MTDIKKEIEYILDFDFMQNGHIKQAINNYKRAYDLASKYNLLEELKDTFLINKMGYLLFVTMFNSLIISDCIPDLLDTLRMFRDNKYTNDKETNYLKLIAAILQDLDLIEARNYLAENIEITSEGFEMLDVVMSPLYFDIITRIAG